MNVVFSHSFYLFTLSSSSLLLLLPLLAHHFDYEVLSGEKKNAGSTPFVVFSEVDLQSRVTFSRLDSSTKCMYKELPRLLLFSDRVLALILNATTAAVVSGHLYSLCSAPKMLLDIETFCGSDKTDYVGVGERMRENDGKITHSYYRC